MSASTQDARAASSSTPSPGLPYRWTQDLASVSVSVDLPKGTRGKDLKVEIGKKSLKVTLKSQPDSSPLISGELYADIKQEDSTWSISTEEEASSGGTVLSIELEKLGHRTNRSEWWPHVLTHDPKIDVTKIEPENSKLGDLDGETRGMVEKMMFDNQQKQMGKPTSDELRKAEMLDRFKQQHPEMNFSNVKMS